MLPGQKQMSIKVVLTWGKRLIQLVCLLSIKYIGYTSTGRRWPKILGMDLQSFQAGWGHGWRRGVWMEGEMRAPMEGQLGAQRMDGVSMEREDAVVL